MTSNLANSAVPVVVVTGGAGFIGSHTVDALMTRGCQVIVVDNFSSGRIENLEHWRHHSRLDIVRSDVADGIFAPLTAITARTGPVSGIVHLAAQTAVQQSLLNPLADVRVNCIGTVQILEYARYMKVRNVVFASSAAVYGDGVAIPICETALTKPISPYGVNKLASEYFLCSYNHAYDIRSMAFRFFNVFGPRQDPNSYYSGVISIFARQAIAGETLTIFGDGQQTRDFVFVGDIARVLAESSLEANLDGGVINLGTGVETTIESLARQVITLTDSPSAICWRPRRSGDIYRSVADISRARETIGFRPTVALVDGLRQTLVWMKGERTISA